MIQLWLCKQMQQKRLFFSSKHFGVTKTKRGNPKCRWLCELVSPFSKCRYTLCPLTCSNLSGVHLHTSLPPIDKKQVIQKRDVFPKGEEYDQHMNKNIQKQNKKRPGKCWGCPFCCAGTSSDAWRSLPLDTAGTFCLPSARGLETKEKGTGCLFKSRKIFLVPEENVHTWSLPECLSSSPPVSLHRIKRMTVTRQRTAQNTANRARDDRGSRGAIGRIADWKFEGPLTWRSGQRTQWKGWWSHRRWLFSCLHLPPRLGLRWSR